MTTLQDNYRSVKQRIQAACDACGRNHSEVKLLAVSKTKPAEMVDAVYQLGQRAFGENYVQDGMDKVTALSHLSDIEWHFIGPLQSNKSRIVAEHFHWLETLDREKIAQRLHDQRPHNMPPLKVLLQVNISAEEQKSGLLPDEVLPLAEKITQLDKLSLQGLMCIPEHTGDDEKLAQQFRDMKALSERLQQSHPQAQVLSMGMSGDLELAIACGSTEVRIGTDIFGARDYPAGKA